MNDFEPQLIERLLRKLVSIKPSEFPKKGKDVNAPNDRGVYVIYDPGGKVIHVGSTPRAKNGIAQRLRDHLYGRSSFAEKSLERRGRELRQPGYRFRCLVIQDPRQRALLESLAIGRLCPDHIGDGRRIKTKTRTHQRKAK